MRQVLEFDQFHEPGYRSFQRAAPMKQRDGSRVSPIFTTVPRSGHGHHQPPYITNKPAETEPKVIAKTKKSKRTLCVGHDERPEDDEEKEDIEEDEISEGAVSDKYPQDKL